MQQNTGFAAYFRPDKLEDSLELLSRQSLRVVAGATDIYPARVAHRAWANPQLESWLDISAISSLQGITTTPTGWRLGALVTWSDLLAADLPPCFNALKAAAREVGGLQIQNRATVAGNLCNASPAADGVPPLLCLDAQVELASAGGKRVIPLAEFILGNRQTMRRSDELLTAIIVPSPGSTALAGNSLDSRFFKLGARKYLVISIVMAAGLVQWDENKNLVDCRFSIGSCSPVAQRLRAFENDLAGLNLDDMARGSLAVAELVTLDHIEFLSPIDDVRADAIYRRNAAVACLQELLESHVSFYRASVS